jgi:hypothetical protein
LWTGRPRISLPLNPGYATAVIARSASDEAIQIAALWILDCFAFGSQ